jgi:beta-barrel assembly-enhancing protease
MRVIAIIALFVVTSALVAAGRMEQSVSFEAVLEMWADVLRDADQFGLKLTRLSAQDEMALGRKLAASQSGISDPYVSAVGAELARHVRRTGIQYEFSVVNDTTANAYALPGGRIYITTALLQALTSESELAAVLGHEIAHVDLRHAVELYQLESRFGTLGQVAEFTRRLVSVGYNKYQELEADTQGLSYAVQAGYDPASAALVFQRLQQISYSASAAPPSPVGQVVVAAGDALRDYFRSHPAFGDRIDRLVRYVEQNRRSLRGRTFYVGRQNLAQKVPRRQQQFPQETISY